MMDTYIVIVDSLDGGRYKVVNTTHATPGVIAVASSAAVAQDIANALNGS